MPVVVLLLLCARLLHAQESIGRPPVFQPLARPVHAASTPNPQSWLDTANRGLVATSYLSSFLPSSSVPTGWLGNVAIGNAGATTQAYRDAVLLRVNWFRQMAGVPTPITFTSSYNSGDQQAALMMAANGQMNHYPPTSWTFYSASGAEAASHSNLCLTIPYLNDPGCVSLYIQDYGLNNAEVGHRRWLLYPQTQNMGTGDVQPPYPTPFANALWVLDTHYYDARPPTRDPFVAWPPKGFIPYQVVPGRWSFSYPGADFTNATVTMQRGGGPVAVRQEIPQQGFGENSVVWVPDNIDASVSTHWPAPTVDTPITVTLAHVLVAGVDTSFTYIVTVFDPYTGFSASGHITLSGTALSGVAVSLNGISTATTDVFGGYSFGPLGAGTYTLSPTQAGYVFSPASRSVSAATTTADFAASLCDFSGIGGTLTLAPRAGTGTYSYTSQVACPWTAVSNASWLTVNPATASGTGPITVNYSYTTNNALARSALLTIAGRTVTVTQPSAGQSLKGPINTGVFLNGIWQIDYNGNGVFDTGDRYFAFQIYGAGDRAVIGDWNGDGHDKVGAYNGGFWALDFNGNFQWDPGTDKLFAFGGSPGEVPIVGDWNGDGRTKIGTYNKGFWALDYNGNGVWDGPVIDRLIAWGGNPGETPLVGDWNGDGRAKVGVFLNGVWQLDYNGNGIWEGGYLDRYYTYSLGPGEKPIIGDWTGSGTTKIGSYKNGFWALNTTGTGYYQGGVDPFLAFGGNPGEVPLVGDWNGNGRSKIGYYLYGFWALDYDGSLGWNAGDRFITLGGNPGEQPFLGKW